MHFISIFLFALSANIDNFIVGAAYGIKKIHLNFIETSIISGIILFGTLVAMAFGKSLLNFIPIDSAGMIGGSMIICMGLYYIIVYCKNKYNLYKNKGIQETCEKSINENIEVEFSKLQCKEIILLGLALSINNAGLGIGASITGLNIILTSIVSFVFSFIFICLGNKLGKSWVSEIIGQYAEPLSGLIIIILGCLEIYI